MSLCRKRKPGLTLNLSNSSVVLHCQRENGVQICFQNTINSVDVFLSGVNLNMNQNILPCLGTVLWWKLYEGMPNMNMEKKQKQFCMRSARSRFHYLGPRPKGFILSKKPRPSCSNKCEKQHSKTFIDFEKWFIHHGAARMFRARFHWRGGCRWNLPFKEIVLRW